MQGQFTAHTLLLIAYIEYTEEKGEEEARSQRRKIAVIEYTAENCTVVLITSIDEKFSCSEASELVPIVTQSPSDC